jgi:hypothetical protein
MTQTEFQDLVLVCRRPGTAPAATAVVRLLGKLPGEWERSWRLDETGGRIRRRVRAWADGALQDPALRAWCAEESGAT